jgi:nitroreductase
MNDLTELRPDVLAELELEQDDRTSRRHVVIKEVPAGSDWNAVEETLLRRRSIRKFKGRQVPAHLIRRMLELGRFAPSQGNCQPWSFVVVRDRKMIAQMEQYCVAVCKAMSAKLDYTHYPKGSWKRFVTQFKTRLANRSRPNALHPIPMTAMKSIGAGRFAVFHRAPTVILLLMDKRGVGSPEVDIGIVGTNIVIAAQSHGLGTCWVGFSKILNSNKALAEKLGVVPPYEIAEAICVGYPIGDPTQNHVARQTHEIVWWEDGKKEILY